MRAQREFADQRAALFHFREQFLVLLRIDDVHARAEHADRRAVRSPASALMRQAVYAARHAADDRQAALGQVMPQPLRHLIAVGRRASRAHHRDRMPVEHAGVSAHVEQRRRIVNFQQPLRIFRLVPIQQAAAQLADLREFLFGILVRALGLDGPRGRGGQMAGLEFGEGGAKDILRAIRIGAAISR